MSEGFNALEEAILEWFKRTYNRPRLSAQIDSAKLARRDWTKVGDWVYLDAPKDLEPEDLRELGGHWPIEGPQINIPGVPGGAMSLLWGSDGYISAIEIITWAGENFPEDVGRFELLPSIFPQDLTGSSSGNS